MLLGDFVSILLTTCLLSWVEITVREPAEPDTLALWKKRDTRRCTRQAEWKIIVGEGVNRRSNQTAQKRIWGIRLKVPGVFQKQKARPHSSHLYRSWTCKNQLPYKNKTQTNWKRTDDPRYMLVIAVILNHWLQPLVCWKVWMWSHPSFSDYCSYSQRL